MPFFFLFVLFDNLRYKSTSPDALFFIPKIFISVFLGLIIDVRCLLDVYLNALETQFSDVIRSFLPFIDKLIFHSVVVALIYLGILIILSFKDIDITEKSKFYLYFISLVLCFSAGYVARHFHGDNTLVFTVNYSIISFFSILMSYFHWPYETGKDMVYEDQGQNADTQQDINFFVADDGN